MKSRRYSLLLGILVISIMHNGCSKEEYLPGLTGKMIGYVYTFGQFGNLLYDHSQVKVTAIGLDQTYAGHTDQNGRFELKDVPTGTYELHFEKSGFGVLKQFGVQHLGGKPTILPFIDSYEHAYFLYEVPTTTITDLSIVNDSLSFSCLFTVPLPPEHVRIKLYFSTKEDFARSEAEFTETERSWNAGDYYAGTLYFQDAPFNPGETVYMKACCLNVVGAIQLPMQSYRTIYGIDDYYDYESKQTIYPGLGDESAMYSFIFPE